MKKTLLLLLVNIWFQNVLSSSHPVTTFLNAKWYATPVCLEIAEYLFDENPIFYWDYVEKLSTLPTPLYKIDGDHKLYSTALRPAETIIGTSKLSLLKLSLSMHSLLPRIQAHFQIAQEITGHGDCGTNIFITVGSRIVCNLDELDIAIEKAKKDEKNDEEIYNFDHVYPGTDNNTIPTVLYGQIGTHEFDKFHKHLIGTSLSNDLKYVQRHYIRNLTKTKARLSGYGVELHLKSTEYKSQDDSPRMDDTAADDQNDTVAEVEGFDFNRLKDRFPTLSHSLDQFKTTLLSKSEEITPLKAWEFQELGLKAVQRIASIQGEEALQILEFISQNFPNQAKSLLPQDVSDDLLKEIKHNAEILSRSLNIHPPDAALFVNGLYFDAETLDAGTLLETLRSEYRVLDGLHKLKIQGQTASELLALDFSSSRSNEFAIDIRDSAVIWINDLENDAQYRRWPSSVMDLLRPTFPGMMRNVRKNLFNLILLVDPIKPDARDIIKLAESFVVHNAPLRLGMVFDSRTTGTKETVYQAILCAFNYFTQQKTTRDALGFLTDIFAATNSNEDVNLKTIHAQMKKHFSDLTTDQIDDILGVDSDFDYGRQVSTEFLNRVGFKTAPQVLLNGVPLQQKLLNGDDFEESILSEIMQQTPVLQKAVYKGELSDSDNVIDYLMQLPHIMPRLNQRILSTEPPTFLDVTGIPHNDLENVKRLAQLTPRDMTATLMTNIKYFSDKPAPGKKHENAVNFLTIWVVGDVNTETGRNTLKNALHHMKASGGIRVAFIPNTEGAETNNRNNINRLVWSAQQTLNGYDATKLVLKWFDKVKDNKFSAPSEVTDLISASELHLKMLRVYANRILNLKTSQTAVIVNGHIIGPLDTTEEFTVDDFSLIERFTSHQYSDKIKKILQKEDNLNDSEITNDSFMKLVTILVPRIEARTRFTVPADIQDYHSAVVLPNKNENAPYFDIFAVLDPASRESQKLASVLILLRNVINCKMKVLLYAVDKHSDMPVKNYYRYVIEPELKFTADGKMTSGPDAKFFGLPSTPLLTQNLQVPDNWMVEIVRSVYDLDNIRLADIKGPVHSEYELEHLLLEGHCFDATSGAPPRGLQFTLGTRDEPVIVDTIVMANLGYFQLKANPGAWILKLRHGKSDEIYNITSVEGTNVVHKTDETRIIISSLRAHVLKMRVTKKPGHIKSDLLSDTDETQGGIWNSIANSFGAGGTDAQASETINIFSVASGHLYERLLRIMMLSLHKHTKSPVKFWFLKNYLSPQFIDFLPHMAKEYTFQYELVQYKWPRWLQQQTEKQRTIWGYKILFLDVLFPLDVKKIIFVDADAIVRADINELNAMDLGGAPYAYTPFCDSRKDMEGFRFWKQGYWRNHLQGRKYHISAIYVVDLKKFRKIAAGDRLRGQYQALSQDPNSLSNLDQDLPNNMIHQVAIKSLPQEWLWCQTWCSDDKFSTAKVIDLCNNPLTKEAKLTAAQRIVPEWKDYDMEIKKLMTVVEDREMGLDEQTHNMNEHDQTTTDRNKVEEEKDSERDIHSEL